MRALELALREEDPARDPMNPETYLCLCSLRV